MSGATSPVTVLALLPSPEDQTLIRQIFAHSNWNLHSVDTIGQARSMMDRLDAGVIISDSQLMDGGWHDVLGDLRRRPVEPPLIVASRRADEKLWAEVLNLGGYDVLVMPFDSKEVLRSVSLAWRYWRDKLLARRARPLKAMAAGSAAARAFDESAA